MEIYDRLLQFTLFQGMSLADLMQVAGHTKFGFSKLVSGKRLVREGDPCTHLIFLTSGTLRVDTLSDDYTCRVSETVSAPYIIQPERIFGINQRYTSSFRAETPCNLITIDKQEVLLLLETQLVFRLNMLSLMAAALPLPCRRQDVLHPDEPDCRRTQRQPTRHQPRPQRHAGRRTAHPPSRPHRNPHARTIAYVKLNIDH